MNKILATLLLAAVTSLAHAQVAPPATVDSSTDECTAFARTLIGKPYDDALTEQMLERKLLIRVVARDKAQYPVTMDYNAGRINVQLQKDVVAGASCG
jgi:hypothetical protein